MSEETITADETTRRDFIYVASGMLGVVGVAGLAWPFIDQMRPDAAVRAAGQPVDIDISSIEPGAAIIVTWRGKPYFVRRLTETEIGAVTELTDSDLKDPAPAEPRIGGPADEATKDWVVVAANCTHLGCIPRSSIRAPTGGTAPATARCSISPAASCADLRRSTCHSRRTSSPTLRR